jgi:hypothetical protein
MRGGYPAVKGVSMIAILFGIFALIIVGAAGTFVYIVSTDIRTDSDPVSKQ